MFHHTIHTYRWFFVVPVMWGPLLAPSYCYHVAIDLWAGIGRSHLILSHFSFPTLPLIILVWYSLFCPKCPCITYDLTQLPLICFTFPTACPAEDLGIPDDRTTFTCGGLPAMSGGGSVDIGNGQACYNSSTLGSVATYQCDQSYILSASLQRTCQCDGTWDGTAPECIRSSEYDQEYTIEERKEHQTCQCSALNLLTPTLGMLIITVYSFSNAHLVLLANGCRIIGISSTGMAFCTEFCKLWVISGPKCNICSLGQNGYNSGEQYLLCVGQK